MHKRNQKTEPIGLSKVRAGEGQPRRWRVPVLGHHANSKLEHLAGLLTKPPSRSVDPTEDSHTLLPYPPSGALSPRLQAHSQTVTRHLVSGPLALSYTRLSIPSFFRPPIHPPTHVPHFVRLSRRLMLKWDRPQIGHRPKYVTGMGGGARDQSGLELASGIACLRDWRQAPECHRHFPSWPHHRHLGTGESPNGLTFWPAHSAKGMWVFQKPRRFIAVLSTCPLPREQRYRIRPLGRPTGPMKRRSHECGRGEGEGV
ncbi:unnamed protein product [Protopolystoma xenopodis]|uniref:Uncharacterized protein n=1 Tax=Protopolystoma xenopodis TaxID=117903 RepID=A0A448WD90_9PLAT|nr:unnamed protein product [Protopolystoma xenopodis]